MTPSPDIESPRPPSPAKTGLVHFVQVLTVLLFVGSVVFGCWKVVQHSAAQRAARKDMEQRLLTGARSVEELLPADYHERIQDANSISPDEYGNLQKLLSKYVDAHGLESVNAYVKIDEVVHVTASSATKAEIAAGDEIPYFHEYRGHSYLLSNVFDGAVGVPVSESYYHPAHGQLHSVFVPMETPGGKIYVLGADARMPGEDRSP